MLFFFCSNWSTPTRRLTGASGDSPLMGFSGIALSKRPPYFVKERLYSAYLRWNLWSLSWFAMHQALHCIWWISEGCSSTSLDSMVWITDALCSSLKVTEGKLFVLGERVDILWLSLRLSGNEWKFSSLLGFSFFFCPLLVESKMPHVFEQAIKLT